MAIFTDWQNGNHQNLGVGQHFFQRCRSVHIPEGEIVTFYHEQDVDGPKSRQFFEGDYNDLSFYGVPEMPGIIEVVKTKLRKTDFVRAYNGVPFQNPDGSIGWYNKIDVIPVGEWNAGVFFDTDALDGLDIPNGLTIDAYDDPDFQGRHLRWSGMNPEGYTRIDLNIFDFRDKISSMRVMSDEWEAAGISLENEVIENAEVLGSTTELAINSEDLEVGASKQVSATVQKTAEAHWDISATLGVKQGFEYGIGTVKGSTEISFSITGGYGQSSSSAESRTITDTVDIRGKKPGLYKFSMYVEYGKMKADIKRKWRNKTTGMVVTEVGKFESSYPTNKTRCEVHRVGEEELAA